MKRYIVFAAVIAVLAGACHVKDKEAGMLAVDSSVTATGKFTPPEIVSDEEIKDNGSDQNKFKAELPGNHGREQVPPRKNHPQTATTSTSNPDWDKKIIKTAHVELEVKEYTKYNQSIHTGLKAYGAYISAEEQNTDGYKTQSVVTIKVPVEQFENLMNSFGGEGMKVVEKKITSEEVTAELIDTKSRLEAKKQTRDQYLNLLKQAKNMKEILEVREEINNIQEEIESAAGRINYLSHQSSYSTLFLTYYQLIDGVKDPDGAPGYGQQLSHAIETGALILWGILIAIVSAWPVILIVIILYGLWKRRRKLQPATAEKS